MSTETSAEETGTEGRNATVASRSWDWGMVQLKAFLRATKGAAVGPVLGFIEYHLRGTRLIFITGETGSGKTSLLEELTGEKHNVGHTLKSGTREYGIWPAIINDEKYLFVDTPGFAAGDMCDEDILENIISCLYAIGPFVIIAGVLFLHSSTKDRMEAGELKTIRWLQCFCGPQFYQNITIVTTKWDKNTVDDLDDARARVEELANDDLAPVLYPQRPFEGAYLYHHGIPGGGNRDKGWETPLTRRNNRPERSAEIKRLIHDRYYDSVDIKLQIVAEIEDGRPWKETEAAKALFGHPLKTKIQLFGDRAIVLGVNDPDPEADSARSPGGTTGTTEPPNERQFVPPPSIREWLQIAHAVAIAFMKNAAIAVAIAVEEVVSGVKDLAWKAWDGVKNFWNNLW